MTGYPRPGLATRLAAAFHGEVGAATVEAYRRAGAAAYSDQADAERVRSELVLSGRDIWTALPHQASQLLCAWNAFALQTLGDELVEADYRTDPRTVGYLPKVTAEQAATFLGEVEHWSARARRAACDETYDVTAEVTVPAPLPKWVEAEPCPRAHLDAMRAAGQAMRGRVEAALDDLTKAKPPPGRADGPDRLFGMAAEANAAIDFAESLWSPEAGPELHERVEDSLRRGIAAYYRLGQLLADQPGFDPWCLTDPVNRSLRRFDPNPAAIYFVYRPVVIAGQSLTPIQQFAFDVSVEPMLAVGGGEFARHLVLGPFHASSQVDYGDRGSGE